MSLTIDTTMLTAVCTAVGNAHNAYIRVVGSEGWQNGPFYWLEQVKSYVRGGNDLTTGIPTGSALAIAAQGSPNATVAVTGGNVSIFGQTVVVTTAASYGSSTIFTQNCTDGSALTTGQFYDAALACDHTGALAVFRGPREDRQDTEVKPDVSHGYCLLATIRINYQAGGTSIISTGNITAGTQLTAYAAPTNDPEARIFSDFDAGQASLISRKAVKNELGFALTTLDKYVQTITASQGLGTNGQGLTLLQWARATHQTASPWDFPAGFAEYVRIIKSGKDPAQRLGTISFTGSGVATVTDLKKVIGLQDKLELVVTSVSGTSTQPSIINVTTQTYGASNAVVWSATVPASQPNGTIIALTSSGTTSLQTPLAGTALNASILASNVLATQPVGTVVVRTWTALVPTNPVTVVGGTSGDVFAIRNVGTL